jgi:hypothetical protein
MGNSASSSGRHHEDTVDFGYLTPQGVYTGPRDYNQPIVSQLICDRKLAPFYRPLEEYEDSWDDEQILAARKELPRLDGGNPDSSSLTRTDTNNTNGLKSGHHKRPGVLKESNRNPEAGVYRGAVECPICFLVRCYFPFARLHSDDASVLSPEHQSLAMLRPGHLHRVFCADKTHRANYDTYSFGARCMSILRPR